MTQSKARRAFTLVELCVVLGILALLAAVLFPMLSASRARARQTTCVNNLHQLYLAFTQYASDHDGMLPMYETRRRVRGVCHNTFDWPNQSTELVASMRPYGASQALWQCPEDTLLSSTRLISYGYGGIRWDWEHDITGNHPLPTPMQGFLHMGSGPNGPNSFDTDWGEVTLVCEDILFTVPEDVPIYSHHGHFNGVTRNGHAYVEDAYDGDSPCNILARQ